MKGVQMDLNNYEWSLKSIKRWFNGSRCYPAWYEKEKVTVRVADTLKLKLKDGSLIIVHNREVIEEVALAKPLKEKFKATVGARGDCVALYIECEHEECRFGLQFLALNDAPSSGINNCNSFVAYLKKFIPVKYEAAEPSWKSVPVGEVLECFTKGQHINGDFISDKDLVPAGLALDEALRLIITNPGFPDTMAVIHDHVERAAQRVAAPRQSDMSHVTGGADAVTTRKP